MWCREQPSGLINASVIYERKETLMFMRNWWRSYDPVHCFSALKAAVTQNGIKSNDEEASFWYTAVPSNYVWPTSA